MALQSGVIFGQPEQQQDILNTMQTHKKSEIQETLKNKTIRSLELSNRLHSTLDLDKLFEIYNQESKTNVLFDSMSYSHPSDAFTFKTGNRKRHSCQYRLLMGGQNLGEVEFTRSKKFTEPETIKIEYLLSSLLNPLHNSLLYKQAILNSQIDPLTNVNNRTAFDSSLSRELSLAKRHNNDFAMIILDIDKFKNINDSHGHLFGDCVLRDVAGCINKNVRDSDIVFRYGGEEFVILLSNTEEDGAYQLAERIRTSIEKMTCKYGEISTKVTVSQGIGCMKKDEHEVALFDRADKALYKAKDNGRNQTILAE